MYGKSVITCFITINVPVVYMTRYVMVAGKIHYEGHWKGRALSIDEFCTSCTQ
jgi:hypothetical protein